MAVGSELPKWGGPKPRRNCKAPKILPAPFKQREDYTDRDSKRCLRVFLHVVDTAGRYQASHFKFVHLSQEQETNKNKNKTQEKA